MEQIAAGKGKAPKPFMLAKGSKTRADATWNSNRGSAAEARAKTKAAQCAGKAKKVSAHAGFRPAAALRVGRAAAERRGWCHEIKFDGYRVQLRVEDGDVALNTRKGLDWADKFPAIAKEAAACRMR